MPMACGLVTLSWRSVAWWRALSPGIFLDRGRFTSRTANRSTALDVNATATRLRCSHSAEDTADESHFLDRSSVPLAQSLNLVPAPQRKRFAKRPANGPLALKSTEQLLLDAAAEFTGPRIVMTSSGAAQAAAAVALRHPDAKVECYYLDCFLAESAYERNAGISNLAIHCDTDFVPGETHSVGLTLAAGADSELARDLMQCAQQLLVPEGKLFVSTDNPKDHWLHEQLKLLFSKVTNRGTEYGRLYIGSSPKAQKKLKDYTEWFAFRDHGRLIHVMSRPGVFSHRRLDLGARALIESLAVTEGPHRGAAIKNDFRVLDMGCGSGAVGFAAALRASNVRVHAVDANVRALQCTEAGAERNGITALTTELNSDGNCGEKGVFDLVLANPPYFSNFAIAEIFLRASLRVLRKGGRAHFVTKQPEWFVEQFEKYYDDVSVCEIRGYVIVKGTHRGPYRERAKPTQEPTSSGERPGRR